MSPVQSEVAGVVISFALHAARAPSVVQGTCLTPTDRIVVTNWQDRAREAGYDRMVIHDRDAGDACEVGTFLSVYQSGQAWSRWGFARSFGQIRAWCCLTGADIGEFGCLHDALEAVLEAGSERTDRTAIMATNLIPLRAYAKQVGSAA